MLIHLHGQATTTPKVRAAIQASAEPASALAARFGTIEHTVYKWKHRDTVHDRSHTPHRLYAEGAAAPVMMSLGLHLRIIGRPGRIGGLERFIAHVQAHDGVWCATRLQIAQAFAAAVPAPDGLSP